MALNIQVYNTLTKQKEPLTTRDEGRVGVYVCGVTPYDYTHVGHARVSVIWDVFRRYLRYRGLDVKFVQNFTDVDDKIINKANREGVPASEIAQRYIDDYYDVMSKLGVAEADIHPRVTTEMDEIIKVISGLIQRGHAYASGGDVFFDVESFPDYGKLSRRTVEELDAGARIEVSQHKRNPMDFALWKAAKPGEPAWDSPWGRGRPGWHIECSVMSLKYLGNHFDIHGGGLDLVFPHHENEVAQSEAYIGAAPFARYWMHNGLVNVADEKMSKSLGNSFAIRDLLKRWDPLTVRYFLISTQYRSPLTYSEAELINAGRARERLLQSMRLVRDQRAHAKGNAGGAVSAEVVEAVERAHHDFIQAMDDDFNTALALATLHNLARDANRFTAEGSRAGSHDDGSFAAGLSAFQAMFEELDSVLGVLDAKRYGRESIEPDRESSAADGPQVFNQLAEGLLALLLEVRGEARSRKDWSTSDKIRDGLKTLGVAIEDTPQGARWKLEKGE
jgi:cysteinyl-tRNA synthetase